MKRTVLIYLIALVAAFVSVSAPLRAQETVPSQNDSLVYVPSASVDAALAGKDIFNLVTVHQSQSIANAMNSKVERNKSRKLTGYRVRIFFDNKQNARNASEAAMNRFQAAYPGYGAYRSFASPYFKVTVGDFRTKSEALQLMQALKSDFPSAFVVKENINYPIVDRSHPYVVDTLAVSAAQ